MTNSFKILHMKKLSYSLLVAVMLLSIAVGCSKSSNDDADSLLRTVPADAASVVLVNVGNIVEKLDGKTDGSTIKLSKEHTKAIAESKALKDEDKKHLKDICDGETGMALNTFVYFSAARSYITGLLNDPEKFIEYEKKQNPEYTVVEEDGAKILGPIAVIGNQFWICLTGTPDAGQLKYYQKLNDKQSYAASDAASLLSDTEKSVTYVADVNKSLELFPNATYVRLGSSLIFKDMAYVAGYADLDKKNIVASAAVLNSDMKPAELLLPADKIDTSIVKSLGNGGNLYFAIAISQKLMKKISDIAGTAMGQGSGQVASVLETIDGTVAVRTNSSASDFEAKIQTTGKDFADLSSVLQSLFGMTVSRDGNILTAVHGGNNFTGKVSSSQAADKMKGAWIGVVSDGFIARDVVTSSRLVPDKKSLRLDVEVEGGVDALMNAFLR